jgi:hypothetical protein
MTLDQKIIGDILGDGSSVDDYLDGTTFELKTPHPVANDIGIPYVTFAVIGQPEGHMGLTWGKVPTPFIFRHKTVDDQKNLRLSPTPFPNEYIGVVTGGQNYWNRYVSHGSNWKNTITRMTVKYYDAGKSADYAGAVVIGYADHENSNLMNFGAVLNTISSGPGDQWFFIKVTGLGTKLANKYYPRAIAKDPAMVKQCCLREYDETLKEEHCKAANHLMGTPPCDAWAMEYCQLHPEDPLCGCINSPLADSPFPVGCDVNCTRASGIYITDPIDRAISGGCNYIDCKQYIDLRPDQQAVMDNIKVSQDCAIDRTEEEAGRGQETTIQSTDDAGNTTATTTQAGEESSGTASGADWSTKMSEIIPQEPIIEGIDNNVLIMVFIAIVFAIIMYLAFGRSSSLPPPPPPMMYPPPPPMPPMYRPQMPPPRPSMPPPSMISQPPQMMAPQMQQQMTPSMIPRM